MNQIKRVRTTSNVLRIEMSRRMVYRLAVIIAASIHLSGCIKDGQLTDLDGTPIVHSEEEIKKAQVKLSRVHSIADVADKTEGAAVFEGVVLSIERVDTLKGRLDSEWIEARFKVENSIFGIERDTLAVVVASPTAAKAQGVAFQVGARYKVLAWIIEDRYVTWAWLGTYRIYR